MHKVFVYGSLLSGMGNHGLLSSAKFIGTTKTTPHFKMMDLGWFPGVVEHHEGDSIIGEVYEVDDEQLYRLDRLEGYNSSNPTMGLYNKKEINTEFGKAIIYIYNNPFERTGIFVSNGDWRTYVSSKKGIL
jgi:gamma-glutamylcyclotransferase (GGCT)/AIG2-like uncharacterized protein YtfP